MNISFTMLLDLISAARETARARQRDLREVRNTLGERYGALQAGTGST